MVSGRYTLRSRNGIDHNALMVVGCGRVSAIVTDMFSVVSFLLDLYLLPLLLIRGFAGSTRQIGKGQPCFGPYW